MDLHNAVLPFRRSGQNQTVKESQEADAILTDQLEIQLKFRCLM